MKLQKEEVRETAILLAAPCCVNTTFQLHAYYLLWGRKLLKMS
jgi:hypothetical protein